MADDYIEFNDLRQTETANSNNELLIQTVEGTKRITVEAFNSPINQAISNINEKIPMAAAADNKLATENFVNEAVQTSSAINRGSFETYAALMEYTGPVTRNDYATVGDDETHNHEAWRYKWNDETEQWTAEYRINEAPMTTEQLAALNSGATSEIISELNNLLVTSYATIYEKTQAEYDELPEADRTNEHKIYLIKANDGSKYIKLCYKDKELISSGGGAWSGTHEEYWEYVGEYGPFPKGSVINFTDDYESNIYKKRTIELTSKSIGSSWVNIGEIEVEYDGSLILQLCNVNGGTNCWSAYLVSQLRNNTEVVSYSKEEYVHSGYSNGTLANNWLFNNVKKGDIITLKLTCVGQSYTMIKGIVELNYYKTTEGE